MVTRLSLCNILKLVSGCLTRYLTYIFVVLFYLKFRYKAYETKKKGVGKVEEKQAVLHEEGKMDDGLDFSRSQEEESRTARVIRKCSSLFTQFIK